MKDSKKYRARKHGFDTLTTSEAVTQKIIVKKFARSFNDIKKRASIRNNNELSTKKEKFMIKTRLRLISRQTFIGACDEGSITLDFSCW